MQPEDPIKMTIDPAETTLFILQIQSTEDFARFESSLDHLLQHYQSTLLDDFCDRNPGMLVKNTSTYMPWLWIVTDANHQVHGMASLSDIIIGRQAYVHGVSHPRIRKHPIVHQLGALVLQVAFETLKVHKVKAEIEANNRGALGYCRRMGFTREAHFKQDNRLNGQWEDVLIYSLFVEQFTNKAAQAPVHPSR